MRFLRRLLRRLTAWKVGRRPFPPVITPLFLNLPSHMASIHRDVTPHGVRVYSLCGTCGARLQASATLCEECAQKRSKPAQPY